MCINFTVWAQGKKKKTPEVKILVDYCRRKYYIFQKKKKKKKKKKTPEVRIKPEVAHPCIYKL